MEHVVITKPTFSADENRNEGTIMTGCKAKFIARLLCPRSLNRRNPNVKGLRYSFDAANLFSLSLSLLSILYHLLPRMRTEYVFLPNRLEKTSFGGIVNARAWPSRFIEIFRLFMIAQGPRRGELESRSLSSAANTWTWTSGRPM